MSKAKTVAARITVDFLPSALAALAMIALYHGSFVQ